MGCRTARLVVGLLAGASALAACIGEASPPALLVGDVAYAEADLRGLDAEQRARLALLTAFGLTVARGELRRLGEPFIERERNGLLLQRLAVEVAGHPTGVDEAALRAAYEADPEYELVLRQIVFVSERWRPEAHRTEARARAQTTLARLRAGEDFTTVAAELSEEPAAAGRAELLRSVRQGDAAPEVWKAASSLDEGETSGPVETEHGYHIVKLEERHVVPFEDVRHELLARAVDLAEAAGRARAWAEEQAASLRVDEGAIAAWRAGRAPDSVALVRWPGGAYRALQLRRHLITLDDEAVARLEAASGEAYASVVAGAARNALLAERAAALGIRLSPAASAAAARRWLGQAEAWAAALGFREGQSVRAVRAAALEALTTDGQGPPTALTEVLAMGPALRALYPIARADPAPASIDE